MSEISKITSNNIDISKKQKKAVNVEQNNHFKQQLESLDNEMEASLAQNANSTLSAKQKAQNMNRYLNNIGNMIEKFSVQSDKSSAISTKQALAQYQNAKKDV